MRGDEDVPPAGGSVLLAGLGLAFYRQGRTDLARAEFSDALLLDPSNVDAHFNLVFAYENQGWAEMAMAPNVRVARLCRGEAEPGAGVRACRTGPLKGSPEGRKHRARIFPLRNFALKEQQPCAVISCPWP